MGKHIIKYSYLFLFYPFVILSIVVSGNTGKSFAPERIIFFYLLFYFLAFFISSRKFTSIYVRFIYLCSLVFSFFEVGYVSLYKERITPSTAFILLETNTSEIKEYLGEYFDVKILGWFLILFVPSFFILKGVNRVIINYSFKEVGQMIGEDVKRIYTNKVISFLISLMSEMYNHRLKRVLLGVVILVVALFIYLKESHHKYHALFQLYSGYEEYLEEIKKYDAFLNIELNDTLLSSVRSNNGKANRETYVLIIGESTSRNHLGIYNYPRNTTPVLSKMEEELVVFNHVISPHTHTIPSLEKVLTFGNYENPEKKYDGSVVQLMRQAGFKTFWISNQVPVGINETMVSIVAKASDYTHFTNLGGKKELRTLDERVLPYYEKAVQDTSQKKFIVVHLLGTHTQYKNRYPAQFDQFKDNPSTPFPSYKANRTINEYDNAVLYNDYILSELIRLLKENISENEKTFALYLSDHGEDVFETVDFTGHSEVIGTKPMFQIPFLLWSNNKNEIERMRPFSNRKYMTDNLIYAIADLANISFVNFTPEKSIFNDSFELRDRIVR